MHGNLYREFDTLGSGQPSVLLAEQGGSLPPRISWAATPQHPNR